MHKVFENKLVKGKAIGAQPTLCDDFNKMQDIIQNFKVIPPLQLEQKGVDWRLSTDSDKLFNPDKVSIEQLEDKTQIVDFKNTTIRTAGITDVLKANVATGKLIANHASQYDLLVRVKNYDGTYVHMAYMPIGDNPAGEDPEGTGDNGGGTVEDWCQHLTDPDGGGGGGSPASNEGDQPHDPKTQPDGSGGGSGEGDGSDGDHSKGDSHPGKSGPCW